MLRHLNLEDLPASSINPHHLTNQHSQLHHLTSQYTPYPRQSPNLQPLSSPQRYSHQSSRSRPGMAPKRKAEDDAEDRGAGAAGAAYANSQRRTSNQQRRVSPAHPHISQLPYSSVSSADLPNGSYPSSAGLSLGASSLTSISSHDRLSPSAVTPTNEHHSDGRNSPYLGNLSLEPSLRASNPPAHPAMSSADAQATAAAAHSMATDNSSSLSKTNAPQLQANLHICDCCPKKPKKFDTLEELQ